MCFWICWLCIRTSMETRLQVLAFIIFHGDKTKQQRDGRGHQWGRWGRRHDGRKWGRVGGCPGRASLCRGDKVCQSGVTSLSDCVSRLLKIADLPVDPAMTAALFTAALCLCTRPYLRALPVKRQSDLCLNSSVRGEDAASASLRHGFTHF